MRLSRRKFSAEFKLRAVRQVEAGASVAAVARRYEIHPTLLSKWRQQLRRDPERAFQRDREPNDEQVHVSELEQMVGRLTMENALLKRPWRGSRNNSFRAPRLQRQDDPLDRATTGNGSRLVVGRDVSCVGGPSRGLLPGSRRITAALRRQDWVINRKRMQRTMRQDNLLCLRRKKFIRTTDSEHGLAVYPNLVPTLDISGLNQLWVADITYIRLLREFVYLAVVLDAFSRRVIGWSLGRTLEAELALAALRMALRTREFGPGLVHHSDRGVQYASGDYTKLLRQHGIGISMSRKANPYDNALAESFMKTLKYEEVYLFEYEDFAEAKRRIGQFLDRVYNEKRLHSALGYLPPVEYEQSVLEQASLAGVVG